ncbi:MAG: hypothetical protein IPH11_10280 [Ignavibacteriales bacterium]|nr:hypothetical protein [Ignavibacteriales bacterium]
MIRFNSLDWLSLKEKVGLPESIKTAFEYANNVLIEEYISGRELTVAILECCRHSPSGNKTQKWILRLRVKYKKG